MLADLFNNKTLKPKQRTEKLADMITNGAISIAAVIAFADNVKDPVKATCMESLEFATKANPTVMNDAALDWVIAQLSAKAPRIKWEAAKVIGNTIEEHPKQIASAVKKLFDNTEHEGTVVRWSAAFALGEILKMKTGINKTLVPAIEAVIAAEEKNSIKKIYQAALKKVQ